MDALVQTQWLAEHINDVQILDASWYLPNAGKDGRALYQRAHIPNAQFFDLDMICDQNSQLPHMLPSADQFSDSVGAMGISDKDTLVIYDQMGLFSAPRVWWMFKLMGHQQVYVLDGGLPKWTREGGAISAEPQSKPPCTYHAKANQNWVVGCEDITQTSDQILDARPAQRFLGQASEPRPNTRSGHIPGSINICFQDVQNSNGTLLHSAGLRNLFTSKQVNLNAPIIVSCGSGCDCGSIMVGPLSTGGHAIAPLRWGLGPIMGCAMTCQSRLEPRHNVFTSDTSTH